MTGAVRDNDVLTQFAEWLSCRWDSAEFKHSYVERRRSQVRSGEEREWSISTLHEARDKYCWNGVTLAENEEAIRPLARNLVDSVESNSTEDALTLSLEILRWGNVDKPTKAGVRPSVKWLKDAAEAGILCGKIRDAVALLKKGDIGRFNGTDLIMDSGITKVLAFADPQEKLIIYDGRVGAALGYLARLFSADAGHSDIPESLKYRWGGARTKNLNRNPSTEVYKFSMLWSGPSKHLEHARMVSAASSLIETVRTLTPAETTARDWEAALFMVGYEIPSE